MPEAPLRYYEVECRYDVRALWVADTSPDAPHVTIDAAISRAAALRRSGAWTRIVLVERVAGDVEPPE